MEKSTFDVDFDVDLALLTESKGSGHSESDQSVISSTGGETKKRRLSDVVEETKNAEANDVKRLEQLTGINELKNEQKLENEVLTPEEA